jgi:hypothetical protein
VSKAAVGRSRATGIAYALFAVVLGFAALVMGQMTYMVRTDGMETSASVRERPSSRRRWPASP